MNKFFHNPANAFAVFLILFCSACKNNQLEIDTSDVEVKLDIRHFEQDLFENKLNDFPAFTSKYPAFINDYNHAILGFQGNDQEAFNQLMMFKTDVNAKKVYDMVEEKFKDFSPYEKELTKAYQHFKYYFPEIKIPVIVTYTSNFSFYMNPVGDGYIGIALDMHMGENFTPYKFTTIENYWKKILIPESIVTNHMMAHANDMFASSNLNNAFVDEMMYHGRLLYFLDATTPWVPDHIKIGMTKAEFDWCKKQEHDIWAFFVKEKYIYDTDRKRFERFFKEGPRTVASGVPDNTPAMIGKFAGWMAVRQYMQEYKDVTLPELMNDKNAKDILLKGGYKP